MKAKLDFRSKRTIIITAIIAALAVGAGIGAYFYAKGNNEASATTQNTDSSQTVTDQAPTSDNNQEKSDSNANNGNENGETATPTDGATGDNAGNDGAANNEANANGNAGNTGNGGATNNGNGGAANNGNAGNGVANNGNAGAGNAGAQAGDNDGDATTTTENIVVENPWESHATSWRPQTLNVSTPEVNVNLPQLDSVKTAYVQGESTEGTPVNNAIQKGGKITYVIKVTNTGNQTANGVMIYDVVPEGTKLVEDSELNKNLTIQTIKQGKKDVQRIVWERNVEAGEDKSISVSFEVEVTADSLNTITNTAKVNGKDTDKTETPVITSSKVAKIENDKVTYVKVGETIEYIIKAKNSSKIDGVTTIEDKIPEGTTLVEDSVEKDEEDVVIQDNKIIWKNVKVPAKTDDKDGEKAVSFKVIVNEQSPKYIENYAVVADTNTNTTKNEVYTDINVKKKWEDNGYESVRPKSVEVGLYNGETKVGDNKTTDRNGKVSFNNLPKYNEDGSKIVYTIKEENNSEFYTASTANTENGYELEITNTLNNPSITSTKKASLVKVEKNEEGKETEKVTELAKGATVEAGDTIRYTITATNNDETKSTIRNISDDVPEGTENARKITKVTINGKAIKGLDGKEIEGVLEESKITWANVPIKAGETVEVSFDVTVSEKTTKMVRNLTAKVGEDPVPEGTENPVANIKIEKISDYEGKADKKKLKEMQEIIYTIKATNSGDGAKTIKISDMVPEGTTLVEGSILINNVAPENEEDVIIEDVEGTDDVKKEKKITWKNVNVPAKTEGKDGEATVSFRVTVNPIKDKKATIVNDKVEKDDEPENTSTTDVVEKEYVTVAVTKKWVEKDSYKKLRTDKIEVALTIAGKEDDKTAHKVIEPKDGNKESEEWTTVVFKKLDKYDLTTKREIEYGIIEITKNDNYKTVVGEPTKGNDKKVEITNTLKNDRIKIDVPVTKIWRDDGNAELRKTIHVQLKDTNYIATLTKPEKENTDENENEQDNNTWTSEFKDVQKYAGENDTDPINYTIEELDVPSYYKSTPSGNIVDGYTIVNEIKYDDEELQEEVKATKVWEDGNNKGGSRPDSITLKLYANNEDTKKSVTLPKDGTETVEDTKKGTTTITASFGKLNKYDENGKITYTVKEAEEQDGKMAGKKDSTYEVKYDDDGLKVTNKVDFTSIKSEVKATKVWEDGNNKGRSRLDSITLKLYADDEDTKKSVTLPKDGKETVEDTEKGTTTITATFGSLSEYDKDGKKIEYTIKEAEEQDGKMSGKKDSTYEVKYDDDGLKVTNKVDFTSIKDELKVTKIWKDEKTKTESRPDSIKIAIYSSKKQVNEYGEEVEVATLEKTVTLPEEASQKSEDRWATDVSLNKYDANGNKISYFIKELDDKNQPIEENGKFTGKANIKYTATYNDKKLEVTNKAETRYVVEYYTNGDYRKEFTIKASADVGDKVSFDKVPTELKDEGFEWIGYKGIGKTEMSDTIQEEIVLAEGDNTIRVYLGKPDVSISKATPDKTVNAYDDINYTITLTNKGWKATEIDVEDELKGTTYVEKSSKVANKAKEPDISKNDKNQVLTWEKVKVAAASESNKETTTEITFKVKTAKDSFGATIDNKAKDATNNKNSNTVNTNVNELTVNYDEYKEGQKGTDLNIIFIVDNSSSMNEPVSGSYDYDTWKYTTYDGEYKFGYPVAKKDKANTRYENAKSALDGFIEAQKKNSNNSITVINFNANATNQASKILVLEEKGYKKEKRYGYDYINDSYVYDSDYSTLNLEGAGAFKICITEKGDKYVQATDGLWHKYSIEDSTQGARVVGSTTDGKTSKNDLQKLVGKMTIGDSRAGFATYISPAYDLAKEYVQNDKKNIVIILADGQFNGKYDTSASALGVDEIYCIAYGSDISGNTSSLDSIATNGKATTATNTQSLLDEFDKIEESATGNSEKNKKTTKGVITLKEASDTIKVSKDCPILVTYDSGKKDKDGNIIYNELFRCESDDEETLEKYGLSIKGKVITWDAKKYINNYMEENPEDTDKVVPSEVFIRYYIPRK